MLFESLPIDSVTKRALEAMGFKETTPVQEQTIPALLEGRDVIAQAQTGTGKTAAFGIPLIEAAREGRRGIVLTPTRELAKQVQRELQAIAHGSPVDVVCLIGGASFQDQVHAIKRHPGAIFVATPGRVVDHLTRKTLRLDEMSILVLDEADEMLSMGFQDEVDAIVDTIPEERQTMLFTATLPPAIEKLAAKALKEAVQVRAGGGAAASSVEQCFALVAGRDKPRAIARLIEAEAPRAALLFARTRQRVEELAEELNAEALHGGMAQGQRDAVMQRFRDGRTTLLVATDVAARGLDVEEVDLVLHDEPAGDVETYIHRIGRTGRAGREGRSILFLRPGAMKRLHPIQKVAGRLEKIQIPTDDDLAALRSERIVQDLLDVEPVPEATDALALADAAGLSFQEVAARALTLLLDVPEEVEPAEAGALCFKVGTIDKVHAGSIVGVLTNVGGLRAEDIGRIDVLQRMSVAEIPASEMDRVCQALARATLSGRKLLPRPAEDWRFKAAKRQ